MLNATDWKERRTDELKEIILNSAASVFNEKGFDRTTTREIARKAAISEGTIYNYFPTKRDLLLSLVRNFAQSARDAFHDKLGDPESHESQVNFAARYFLERLQLFNMGLSPTLILYHAKRDPDVRAILDQILVASMGEMLRPRLENLRDLGLIRDIDIDFLIMFLRSIVFGIAVLQDIEVPGDRRGESLEELSNMARDLVWNGIVKGNNNAED
ncbi:MAG TPA: TetR/AcrR family transcriptional regulator [Spirochaetia bacterium]|nr:TetR/AcrR family transcriptional regulator [Spirochaetia bacterium]